MCHLIANYPLPAHLQVWVSAAEPHDFGNHGDSLLDNPSDYSLGSPGDSLSVEVAIPVEETTRLVSLLQLLIKLSV